MKKQKLWTDYKAEAVMKNLPQKENPTVSFIGECYQTFKEELMALLLKFFQNIEKQGNQTHFMRPELQWYQIQVKALQEKKTTGQYI